MGALCALLIVIQLTGVKMPSEPEKTDIPDFTASVDGLIVEGFLSKRTDAIEKLKDMGFTQSAITDRAKYLGLSEQFIKWCSVGNPRVALRNCLGCGERFLSVGFQNRLCPRCRNRRS